MQKTRLEDFQRELVETGAYHTHKECQAKKRSKPGAFATMRFCAGILNVFPSCAIAEPLGLLDTRRWAGYCFKGVTAAEGLGMNVFIDGFRNRMAINGPVLYLCNHMSTAETIILPPVLLAFGPFSYVAKASLARLPLLAKAAEHMRMVPIGRVSPREDLMRVLTVGTERIRGGESFLIYPQGTRMDVFSRAKYSSIGVKLAERAGCPVMPIVVDTRCLPIRRSGILRKVFRDFGPVDTSRDIRICCGPAITCGKAKEMHDAAFCWMAGKLEEWGLPVER